MKALLIDDSSVMRRIIGTPLKEWGYDIVQASNGLEGLDALKLNGDINLIMLDWNMPKMNGYDFLKAVRARPEFKKIRIIMVTTETERERMEMAMAAGASDFIMKPFTREDLKGKVSPVISA